MKPASAPLINYLATRDQYVWADCYQFVLKDDAVNPTILRYTTAQGNVTAVPPGEMDFVTYEAGNVLVKGLKYRLAVGTDVDEQECEISARPDALVLGVPFIVAARAGILDGAIVSRTRYYFDFWGDPAGPVGGIVLFRGLLSTMSDIGDITMTAKVKSGMVLLNTPMPHNLQQPQCRNTLFDSQCGLDPADWAVQGTVETGSTRSVILWSSSIADEYSQGTIRFESGPNIGSVRTIRQSTSGSIIMTFPLDYLPTDTDDFVVFPGCDKSQGRCTAFANIANFRGFPFVPPPETAT